MQSRLTNYPNASLAPFSPLGPAAANAACRSPECSQITLDEISEHQGRIRQRIAELECVLAALDVMHAYLAREGVPKSVELSPLLSFLAPGAKTIVPLPMEAAAPPEPAPSALATSILPASLPESGNSPPAAPAPLPADPPAERYVHPDLKSWDFRRQGGNPRLVRWAIPRMTGDYSLYDIDAMLMREGAPMARAEISVVLSRMKARGEIEEIRPGAGPIPALFRGPAEPTTSSALVADDSVMKTATRFRLIPEALMKKYISSGASAGLSL